MSKSKHLTLDERIEIESMLKEGLNFTEIGEALGKHFSTISKEWWHFDYKGAKNEEVLNIRF